MANLQLANKCNLFSYSFSGENQETLPKTQGIIPKTFQIWAKNSRIWKKLKDMRPCWAYWASKKCTKNKPVLYPQISCKIRAWANGVKLADYVLDEKILLRNIAAVPWFLALHIPYIYAIKAFFLENVWSLSNLGCDRYERQ